MSQFRATVTASGNAVMYGLDRMYGWFYTEFDKKNDKTVVELDSYVSGGLSRGKLIELLEKTNAPYEHKMRIALDLDPAG